MKNFKNVSYALIMSLGFGFVVPALQALPLVDADTVEKAFLFWRGCWDNHKARRFHGLRGDALLEELRSQTDLRELLNAEIPSEEHYWGNADVLCYRINTILVDGAEIYRGDLSLDVGGSYTRFLHAITFSLSDTKRWKKMTIYFINAALAKDVHKRIKLLADKRGLNLDQELPEADRVRNALDELKSR